MFIKLNFTFILIFLFAISYGQDELKFFPTFDGKTVKLNQKCVSNDYIYTFKKITFYIGEVIGQKTNYHLIDLPSKNSMMLSENSTDLYLILGVDSLTNNDGIGEGDLDPIKGMYWAWQTGYINIKIEGEVINKTTNKKKVFEYHLGGFRSPSQNASLFHLTKPQNGKLYLALDQWVNSIKSFESPMVLIPSRKSNELTQQLTQCFYVK